MRAPSRRTSRSLAVLAAGFALLAGTGTGGAATVAPSLSGEWRNIKNTVHIRAYPCGDAVCGTVTWASEAAEAKARDKGADKLEGTQIFREFKPVGDGNYTGKLYVPTVGRTFAGKLKVTPDNKLVGKGCVLGGLFCKTTTWVRIN